MNKDAGQPAASTTPPQPKEARLRLRLKPSAETVIRGGHPWVFDAAIRDQSRPGKTGELAVIYDRNDRFLAIGFYDPDSPIRVRVLHTGKPVTLDDAWWEQHLRTALARREKLFDNSTTGYRLINGESDGWPGLVLDRYADTVVMKLYSAIWLPKWSEWSQLLKRVLPDYRIVLRLSRNIQAAARNAGLSDGAIIAGTPLTGPVIFQETGLRFEAEVVQGQKTGFFLDQRENRRIVETLTRHGHGAVLNAFSFSGGFSLYAARGGARSVTDLDISAHALESARRNFALNQDIPTVKHCRHEGIQTDAFEWLAGDDRRSFDLVILDPPSLAKRESERAGAIIAYQKLAASGLRRVKPGGHLVAASCSAHVTEDEFFAAVRQAATRSGRRFEEERTTKHAPDHAATFREGHYLKCIYLRVN